MIVYVEQLKDRRAARQAVIHRLEYVSGDRKDRLNKQLVKIEIQIRDLRFKTGELKAEM